MKLRIRPLQLRRRLRALVPAFAFVLGAYTPGFAQAQSDGGLDASFNATLSAGSLALGLAIQPDARVIVAGNFTSINGTARNGLARLNADGSPDGSFTPGNLPNGFATSTVLLPDGKVLISGTGLLVNGTGATSGIARLNPDGSLDASFQTSPGVNGAVYSILVQRDGKLIIGGDFTQVQGVARPNVARLNADGSVDPTFNAGSGTGFDSFSVFGLAQQPDGQVLLAGAFTTVNGVARSHIARLNADGSLDLGFNPGSGADGMTNCLVVLPDGHILLGGDFFTYNGTARSSLARLNADGTLDASYDAKVSSGAFVNALSRQADGRIIVGGKFTTINGFGRNGLARLNADGSLDASFDPGSGTANLAVYTITLGGGGKFLIGGQFNTVNGAAHRGVARLFDAGAVASSLINISARARVETGDNVLIGGFVVGGMGSKRVMVRAIAPSLAAQGVAGVLADPQLTLINAQGSVLAANDSWQSTQAAEITSAGLAPGDPRECAIIATLAPGGYTAIVSGAGATTGVALVEVYDLELLGTVTATPARLLDVSTRARVGTGDNVLIGGFAIRGTLPRRVIVRAIGPDLTNRGVTGALLDPFLTLLDDRGAVLGTNDNWRSSQQAAITASGFAPADDRESAIIATLQPGNYTAIVTGVGATTGVALVEAYELP